MVSFSYSLVVYKIYGLGGKDRWRAPGIRWECFCWRKKPLEVSPWFLV